MPRTRTVVLFVFFGLTACDDHEFKSESVAVSGEGLDAVKQVMEGNCASCHSVGSPSAGLDLTPDNFCVNVMDGRMVIPGNASGSVLQQRMEGDPSAMPPTGLMDDANIQIIADWIDAGADCEGIGEDGDDIDDEDDGDDDGGGDGTTDPSEGAAIYAASCSGCHGVDGEGISGFSPSMGEAVADRTAAEVAHIVLNGSGTMGPVALDTDDANTVAEYCVSEFGS